MSHTTTKNDPWFLVIGAKQVQTWISMTPRLRLVRGASRLLEDKTDPGEVQDWLSKEEIPAVVSGQAGKVAGVVALEIRDPENLNGVVPPARAEKVAGKVAARLLVKLASDVPGIAWEGWLRQAPHYVRAYADHLEAERTYIGRSPVYSWTPTPGELTFVGSCPGCRAEPSLAQCGGGKVDKRDENTTEYPYGHACAAKYKCDNENRNEHGKRLKVTSPEGGEGVTYVVWGQGELQIPIDAAHDFNELAAVGGLKTDGSPDERALLRADSRTHLAVISADGNSMGQFFARLLDLGLSDYGVVTHALSDGIHRALHVAAKTMPSEAVTSEGECVRRGIERHLVGGDDILVTVVANRAWKFVEAFIHAFEADTRTAILERLKNEPTIHEIEKVVDDLSIGVGVAFAHRSHPFAEIRQAAEVALKRAKGRAEGKRSVVGFCDITVDGTHPQIYLVDHRTLAEDLPDVSERGREQHPEPLWTADARRVLLESLSKTALHRLANLLIARDGRSDDPMNHWGQVEKHLRRIAADEGGLAVDDLEDLIKKLPDPGSAPTDDDQKQQAKQALDELTELAIRARWWPGRERSGRLKDPSVVGSQGAPS